MEPSKRRNPKSVGISQGLRKRLGDVVDKYNRIAHRQLKSNPEAVLATHAQLFLEVAAGIPVGAIQQRWKLLELKPVAELLGRAGRRTVQFTQEHTKKLVTGLATMHNAGLSVVGDDDIATLRHAIANTVQILSVAVHELSCAKFSLGVDGLCCLPPPFGGFELPVELKSNTGKKKAKQARKCKHVSYNQFVEAVLSPELADMTDKVAEHGKPLNTLDGQIEPCSVTRRWADTKNIPVWNSVFQVEGEKGLLRRLLDSGCFSADAIVGPLSRIGLAESIKTKARVGLLCDVVPANTHNTAPTIDQVPHFDTKGVFNPADLSTDIGLRECFSLWVLKGTHMYDQGQREQLCKGSCAPSQSDLQGSLRITCPPMTLVVFITLHAGAGLPSHHLVDGSEVDTAAMAAPPPSGAQAKGRRCRLRVHGHVGGFDTVSVDQQVSVKGRFRESEAPVEFVWEGRQPLSTPACTRRPCVKAHAKKMVREAVVRALKSGVGKDEINKLVQEVTGDTQSD